MVKRYSMVYDPETTLYGMDEEYDGDYVTYDDYQSLEVALKRVADYNGRLEAERDEADRRAGSAERNLVHYKAKEMAHSDWLNKAKRDAGYGGNISFDEVWNNTLKENVALKELNGELVDALEEAVGWNWLEYDSGDTIPVMVQRQIATALKKAREVMG